MGQEQEQEQKVEVEVVALIVKEVVKVLQSVMDWMRAVAVAVEVEVVVQAAEMQKMVFLKSLVVVEACSRAQVPMMTVSVQALVEVF